MQFTLTKDPMTPKGAQEPRTLSMEAVLMQIPMDPMHWTSRTHWGNLPVLSHSGPHHIPLHLPRPLDMSSTPPRNISTPDPQHPSEGYGKLGFLCWKTMATSRPRVTQRTSWAHGPQEPPETPRWILTLDPLSSKTSCCTPEGPRTDGCLCLHRLQTYVEHWMKERRDSLHIKKLWPDRQPGEDAHIEPLSCWDQPFAL